MWWFPEIGVPANHPFFMGVSLIKQPFWGIFMKPPQCQTTRTCHVIMSSASKGVDEEMLDAMQAVELQPFDQEFQGGAEGGFVQEVSLQRPWRVVER